MIGFLVVDPCVSSSRPIPSCCHILYSMYVWPVLAVSYGLYWLCPMACTGCVLWFVLAVSYGLYWLCTMVCTSCVLWPVLAVSDTIQATQQSYEDSRLDRLRNTGSVTTIQQ